MPGRNEVLSRAKPMGGPEFKPYTASVGAVRFQSGILFLNAL